MRFLYGHRGVVEDKKLESGGYERKWKIFPLQACCRELRRVSFYRVHDCYFVAPSLEFVTLSKTKIPSHLVEELRAGGELLLKLLLLSQGHVLEAHLSRCSRGGGDLMVQLVAEEGRLVDILTREVLVEVLCV